jgi:hypothetical protein
MARRYKKRDDTMIIATSLHTGVENGQTREPEPKVSTAGAVESTPRHGQCGIDDGHWHAGKRYVHAVGVSRHVDYQGASWDVRDRHGRGGLGIVHCGRTRHLNQPCVVGSLGWDMGM